MRRISKETLRTNFNLLLPRHTTADKPTSTPSEVGVPSSPLGHFAPTELTGNPQTSKPGRDYPKNDLFDTLDVSELEVIAHRETEIALPNGLRFKFRGDLPGRIRFTENSFQFLPANGEPVDLLGKERFRALWGEELPGNHIFQNGSIFQLPSGGSALTCRLEKGIPIITGELVEPNAAQFEKMIDAQIRAQKPIRPIPQVPYPVQPFQEGPVGFITFQYENQEALTQAPLYLPSPGDFVGDKSSNTHKLEALHFQRIHGRELPASLAVVRNKEQRFGVATRMVCTLYTNGYSPSYDPAQVLPLSFKTTADSNEPAYPVRKPQALVPFAASQRGLAYYSPNAQGLCFLANVRNIENSLGEIEYIAREGQVVTRWVDIQKLEAGSFEEPAIIDDSLSSLNNDSIRQGMMERFTQLKHTSFKIVAPPTSNYNCFSLALGIHDWFSSAFDKADLDQQMANNGFIRLNSPPGNNFAELRTIENVELAVAYGHFDSEKSKWVPRHFVRGVDGTWYSKNGAGEHIQISQADAMRCSSYGEPYAVYARPRMQWREVP